MEETIPDRCHVKAWAPDVPGLAEVFHAHLVDYAYPPHCHDRWTVLIIDHGAIRYDLDTRHCGAAGRTVAILPPGVVHDGGPANGTHDFRKRNLYLDGEFFPADLVGPAVDHTNIDDTELWTAIAALHETLAIDGDVLDAEARLALIGERITGHLIPRASPHRPLETPVADALREFLDAHALDPVSLQHAADILERSVAHLVRSFTRRFGVSPYAYVIGRRVDAARRRLLDGIPPAEVATSVGFYDQAHLTRHFKRHTSTTPTKYATSHR